MLSVFLTILPVFILLGTGYATARTGYLKDSIADALNAFTIRLAVPVLLFRAMYRLDIASAFHPPMLASFYLGAIASFALATLAARLMWNRRPGEAVAVGFCAFFSNSVLLGLPIAERAYGHDALTPVFGIVALHAPLIYTIGMTVMELARADGRPLRETLAAAMKSVFSNTLMIGIVLGLLANLSGLPIPESVMAPIGMLASAAIPVALIGIGATLPRYRLKADLSEASMVAGFSLVAHPLIAYLASRYLFGLPHELVRAATVIAAMPPGMNVYVFASIYNRAVSVAATSIVLSTALSVLTISGWIWFLG